MTFSSCQTTQYFVFDLLKLDISLGAIFIFFSRGNTVLTLWEGFGTKLAWLGLGKLKTSRFLPTNTAVDVPTSCQKCLFFVVTNTAGNFPEILSETHKFASKNMALDGLTSYKRYTVYVATNTNENYPKILKISSSFIFSNVETQS